MTLEQAYQYVSKKINQIYDSRETANITHWVIEHITGFSKIDRIIHKHYILSSSQQKQLEQYIKQLLQHIPVQYVLHEAWFLDQKFYVDKNVLIPRPETEELVQWVVSEYQYKKNIPLHVIDVGTGSGCIAISLKKKIPLAQITAIDISNEALAVAKKNAQLHKGDIDFLQIDFLDKSQWKSLPIPDILISNPPYIPIYEKQTMNKNVKNYEPSNALFVPDEEPLIFYKTMINYALQYMQKNSVLYAEMHEHYSHQVQALCNNVELKTTIKKDMQEKNRMIKVVI